MRSFTHTNHTGAPRHRRYHALAKACLAIGSLTACDSLLEVDLPGQVVADDLDDPAIAQTLVLSAIADFECAYANYTAATALYTDEVDGASGWFSITVWDTRDRRPENTGFTGCEFGIGNGYGIYRTLQTARFQAQDVFRRIQAFDAAAVPDKTPMLATVKAYAGYSTLLLSEAYCRTTFAEIDANGDVVLGGALTRDEGFANAEALFGEAIATASGDILTLAHAGRARARLNRGDVAGAQSDAEEVPSGFEFVATRSSVNLRRWNHLFDDNQRDNYWRVNPSFRNLTFGGVADPRMVAVDAARPGHDGVTPMWYQQKFMALDQPIPMARWEEAQLIIAEAQGGQAAVDIINALHAAQGLPDWVPNNVNDATEILSHIVEERRRELYLEGYRMGDALRYGLEADAFPEGLNQKGQRYFSQTCLPLPQVEIDNNPMISQ